MSRSGAVITAIVFLAVVLYGVHISSINYNQAVTPPEPLRLVGVEEESEGVFRLNVLGENFTVALPALAGTGGEECVGEIASRVEKWGRLVRDRVAGVVYPAVECAGKRVELLRREIDVLLYRTIDDIKGGDESGGL